MTEGLVEVRLLNLSVDAYQRSSEHHDELVREFALINEARRTDSGAEDLPGRLLALVDDLTARFAGFSSEPRAALQAALDRGEKHIDLVYSVPPAAGPAAAEFDRLLDEADEFCRAGDLLTLATPPDTAAFRRWFLGEFVAQAAGAPPTPWPGGYGKAAGG
jgi:hypothetical protein